MRLEHQHFNRICKIITNPKNTVKNLTPITNIMTNYRLMFGCSKLYLKLLQKQTELYKTL